MLIDRRLAELGHDLSGFKPHLGERSKLFRYLYALTSTVERVAAAQFTREAIGYKSNELFIAFCEEAGDRITARMYREQIQPDEKHHHEWGKRLLEGLATSPGTQLMARNAIIGTLNWPKSCAASPPVTCWLKRYRAVENGDPLYRRRLSSETVER